MSDFLENDVQVFPDYTSAPLIAEPGAAISEALLSATRHKGNPEYSNIDKIIKTRRDLRDFINNPILQIIDGKQGLAPARNSCIHAY